MRLTYRIEPNNAELLVRVKLFEAAVKGTFVETVGNEAALTLVELAGVSVGV
jgi:hypothetical protein